MRDHKRSERKKQERPCPKPVPIPEKGHKSRQKAVSGQFLTIRETFAFHDLPEKKEPGGGGESGRS